jgi:uncharacterized protein (DUF433 family)
MRKSERPPWPGAQDDAARDVWYQRSMAGLLDRITINPTQCGGRPCIRGMRIRVQDILEMLSGGMTREQILAGYDELEPDDIAAALTYA